MALKRLFSARSGISGDLVLSASMGYAGKSVSSSHQEHAEALKKLNLFTDPRIEFVIKTLDKSDFCQ
jgi:hypothetical protein